MPGVQIGARIPRGRLWIMDTPEKGLHCGKCHLYNLSCNVTVRLAVNALSSILVRCVDETEGGPPIFVEPVCEEFYPILILDFEILAMRLSNFCGSRPFQIVP